MAQLAGPDPAPASQWGQTGVAAALHGKGALYAAAANAYITYTDAVSSDAEQAAEAVPQQAVASTSVAPRLWQYGQYTDALDCAETALLVAWMYEVIIGVVNFVLLQGVQLPRSPAAAQLAVLDQLLWPRKHTTTSSSSSSATADMHSNGASSGTFRSWLSQLALKMALGRLDVQLKDCCCQLVVPWQLGPQSQLPGQASKQQYDGAAVNIRMLTVSPSSSAAGGSNAAASSGNVQGASLHNAIGKGHAPCVAVAPLCACSLASVHAVLVALHSTCVRCSVFASMHALAMC